ncbi:hypothetical protein OS493_021930 [Desmophyllum pertusum]|uniref:Uncharacterized protein n=1 Tax=Desmophyllum pertusum TaxID=174260 RepID=A0A9X0CYX6_9CNID|nr:hypothetical protein OS493_021930 [Desmophyllum pertusum]
MSRPSKDTSFDSIASTSQEGLEEEDPSPSRIQTSTQGKSSSPSGSRALKRQRLLTDSHKGSSQRQRQQSLQSDVDYRLIAIQEKLPSSRTELYQMHYPMPLRRYCAKHNLEAPDDDKALEEQFEDSLLALGELAWRCLQEVRVFMSISQLIPTSVSLVSGILGEEAGVLFKQIGEKLKTEHWDWVNCSDEEATFFTDCFSESRNAEQVAMTLCSFIPFPLTLDINGNYEEDAAINV